MKKTIALITAFLIFSALPVYAIELQDAKSQGLVGEAPSGYLEAVTAPSAEIQALITSINSQRKAKYQEIATENKTTLQTIEQLAGQKDIEKSSTGSYIKHNGSWQKK